MKQFGTTWFLGILTAFAPQAHAQTDDIAKVEKGLFKDAKGPRWTIQERMEFHKVPGVSIAVLRDHQIAWAKGYGVTEAGGSHPIGIDTLFQACSMSKPLAALLALLLADQGMIDVDEDVNKYLKRWKVPDNAFTRKKRVTVRELVCHSAGVTVHGFPGYQAGTPHPSLPQLLRGMPPTNTPAINVDLEPGTNFRYSGGGFCILQCLIEDVTGKTLAEVAQTKLLKPIGMAHSNYRIAQKVDAKLYAAGHTAKGTVIAGKRNAYPESAAAGLYTTPSDYAHFGLFVMNKGKVAGKQIIAEKWMGEVLRKQAPNANVGWGIFLFPSGFSHNGANAGFRCDSVFFTARGAGVIVMTNGDNGGALTSEIVNSVRAAYGF